MQNRSSWNGFLPPHALVMGRVRPPTETSLEEPVDTPIEPLCPACDGNQSRFTGEGNPKAELIFVGVASSELAAPPAHPFSGQSGELLDKMIEAMGLSRAQVYLCATPSCSHPFERQVDQMQPKIIVALGESASRSLLQTEAPLTELRGRFHEYRGAKLLPTFHPADLLRNPVSKREAWSDLQAVARALGIAIPNKKG